MNRPFTAGRQGAAGRSGEETLVEPSDVQTIQSIVTQVMHAIDMRRWAALPPLFADEVTTDYTSLFGGDIQRQPRKQLIDGWQHLLSSLDATQHLLGPIDVRVRDTHAVAECHVRGYHVSDKAKGGHEWMVAGHYIFELETQAGVWHVCKVTLRTLYQTGNRDLLREAADASAPPASG